MADYISIFAWRNPGEPPEQKGLWKVYHPDKRQHIVQVFLHKGIMCPLGPGHDYRLVGFLPEEGKWMLLSDPQVRGALPVHRNARYAIVRFVDVHFLPGFGEALTKASAEWYDVLGEGIRIWPPEQEGTSIIIHGIGTRIVRIVFWTRDASLPTEFAVRLDEGLNIEPVLYDALARCMNYTGEIDFWNVSWTNWFRLPKESSWELARRYTTFCIRASEGVKITPGLGWELTQLEHQHGGEMRDVGTDVQGLPASDDYAVQAHSAT